MVSGYVALESWFCPWPSEPVVPEASPDPVVVADAIYPLVIFNCVLFALVISFPRMLPPAGALPRGVRIFARVTVWSLAWLASAWLITDFRAVIPGAAVLFGAASIFAIGFMLICWTKAASADVARMTTGFTSFWANPTGLARISFFILAYACLFFASRVSLDEKWVGMASALRPNAGAGS